MNCWGLGGQGILIILKVSESSYLLLAFTAGLLVPISSSLKHGINSNVDIKTPLNFLFQTCLSKSMKELKSSLLVELAGGTFH